MFVLHFDLSDKKKKLWSGTIEMEVPLNHERLAVLGRCRVGKMMGSKDIKTEADEDKASVVNAEVMASVYGEARKLIKKVDLVSHEGEKVESLDAFETHPALMDGVAVVAAQYIGGFGPGKSKSPS